MCTKKEEMMMRRVFPVTRAYGCMDIMKNDMIRLIL